MTSQTFFFEIMGYDVKFLKHALVSKIIISSELQSPTEIYGIKVW